MEKKKMSPKLRLALIILGVYLLVLLAAAVLIDGRHAEITLLGESEMTVEVGETFTDPGAEAISTGRMASGQGIPCAPGPAAPWDGAGTRRGKRACWW